MDEEHPDLIEVGRRLQRRFDAVLDAEREAAAIVARRSATLRDRLLEIEDLECPVTVWIGERVAFEGHRIGVGADHIEVVGGGNTIVPIDSIEAIRWP